MKVLLKCVTKCVAPILITFGAVAYAVAQTPANRQSSISINARRAEQHLASVKKAQLQQASYLTGLADSVKGEKRNEAWAAQMESKLEHSYAGEKRLPGGGIQSVECRSSKCDLQLQFPSEHSPKALVEQEAALTHWISVDQPCAYTMIHQPAGRVRIFLDCSR